jgi:hypothetical protein
VPYSSELKSNAFEYGKLTLAINFIPERERVLKHLSYTPSNEPDHLSPAPRAN